MPNQRICSHPHGSVLLAAEETSELRGAKRMCVMPKSAARSMIRL